MALANFINDWFVDLELLWPKEGSAIGTTIGVDSAIELRDALNNVLEKIEDVYPGTISNRDEWRRAHADAD